MTVKKLILLTLALLTLSPSLALSESPAHTETAYARVMRTGILRCGYSPWPPFFSVDPNTKVISGTAKDTSDVAAKILGWKIEYIETPVGTQIEDMKSGKIDAMCGDGPWVLSTIKFIDYTKPFFYVSEYLYGRADEKRFASEAALNNGAVTFAAIDADVSTDLVLSNFPQAKLSGLSSTIDPSQLLLNVATRKADVVITDPVTVSVYAKNNPGKVKILFKRPIAIYTDGFSVLKGETDLLNTLNGAVDIALNTNQVAPVLKKYDPDGTLFLQVAAPYQSK